MISTAIKVFCVVFLFRFVIGLHSSEQINLYENHDPVNVLPFPHIVIVGATGVGKSSLANVFIGESPLCSNCTFPICNQGSSCTKETTYAVQPWLGQGDNFTVVDTPGFGDSEQDDSKLIDEMMSVLKDSVKSANVLLLVLKGTETRLDGPLQQMLREMKALFGDDMWAHVVIGVSFWSYSENAVEDRNRTCIYNPEFCHDEKWFKSIMMSEIEAKFDISHQLPFVFIDSWSQHPANIDDTQQQEAFLRETNLLWEFANEMDGFNFKSIQDVLAENHELRTKLTYLEGVLEDNITEILTIVFGNTKDISDLRIKQSQTTQTLLNHENNFVEIDGHFQTTEAQFVTIDGSLSSHSELLDGQGQRLAAHDQKLEETNVTIQGIKTLVAAQGVTLQTHTDDINSNGQVINGLANEFHTYQGIVLKQETERMSANFKKGILLTLYLLYGQVFCFGFTTKENVIQMTEDETSDSLPSPHIVIVGATGVGKSSLANVFIGESPLCSNCTFPICNQASSCTKETTYAVRPWLGDQESDNFTVVDTPGFGDTEHDDSELIDEMMMVLKDSVKSANILLLILKGTETRLDGALQQMLREMKALFGEDMWSHVVVGVSFWSYSESNIHDRNKTCTLNPEFCHDENWFKKVMTEEIEAKFHIGSELPFVFIDSWAKHPANLDDPFQQEAFDRETDLLWEFANGMKPFDFKSVQDVLAENQELKAEVSYLKGVLEGNITEIFRVLSANTEDITDLRIQQTHTFTTLTDHENHLSTVDTNLTSHASMLEGQNQRLGVHDQKLEDTNTAIQGNAAQITAQGATLQTHTECITSNSQLITAVGDEFHAYQGIVTNDIGTLRAQITDTSATALRRCRICFVASGDGDECRGVLNSCSGFAQYNEPYGDWTPAYYDDTDAGPGGCNMQWKLECYVGL